MGLSNHPSAYALLDLVVPCYNPSQDWASHLKQNLDKLQKQLPDVTIRLILVNDGSIKGIHSEEIQYLQEQIKNFTYLTYPTNKGKGYALRTGVAESTSPFCIYTDIDFPYQEESIAKIYKTLTEAHIEVAVGVREANYYAHVPPARTKISKLLKALIRSFLKLPITDTQCGLKGFNAFGRQIFLQTKINRYLFDLEFIFLASKQTNITMQPVVVQLKPGIVFSKMNLKVLVTESYSFFTLLIRNSFPTL